MASPKVPKREGVARDLMVLELRLYSAWMGPIRPGSAADA